MKTFYFSIKANYEKCETLYLSTTNVVIVRAESGERVQLPSLNLRPFVTKEGINGRFRLMITAENKVHSFERVKY